MGAFLGRALYVDRHKDTAAVAAVTAASAAAFLPFASPAAAAAAAARAACVEFGIQLYVTFVAGPTMIFNMERPTFADVQSKLFPKYGLVTTAIGIWALLSAFFGADKVKMMRKIMSCWFKNDHVIAVYYLWNHLTYITEDLHSSVESPVLRECWVGFFWFKFVPV